jgi:hypothetical protein
VQSTASRVAALASGGVPALAESVILSSAAHILEMLGEGPQVRAYRQVPPRAVLMTEKY